MKVGKFGVGRKYNLGDFENIEFTVWYDVSEMNQGVVGLMKNFIEGDLKKIDAMIDEYRRSLCPSLKHHTKQ